MDDGVKEPQLPAWTLECEGDGLASREFIPKDRECSTKHGAEKSHSHSTVSNHDRSTCAHKYIDPKSRQQQQRALTSAILRVHRRADDTCVFSQKLESRHAADEGHIESHTSRREVTGFTLRLVKHRFFIWLISAIIVLNSIYIGVETQVSWMMNDDQAFKMPWYAFEVVFVAIFMVEITLRIIARGKTFFYDSWNVFDCVLVFIAVVDTFIMGPVAQAAGPTDAVLVIRMVRLVRLLRILRAFRILRFSSELWLMVMGMLSAMRTLFWAWMLLLLVIYICSICVTRTIGQESDDKEVDDFFGTIPKSTFSLFQILTVDDWVDIIKVAEKVNMWSWAARPFFVCFVAATTFAILNLVVAVIVEKTLENSVNHDAARLREMAADVRQSQETIKKLFYVSDKDSDNMLSKREFMTALTDPAVMRFMHQVGVDVRRADGLFDILDYDESGVLDFQEFVDGVMDARGEARSKDLLEIQCGLWRWEESSNRRVQDIWKESNNAADAMLYEVAMLKAAVGKLRESVDEPLQPT